MPELGWTQRILLSNTLVEWLTALGLAAAVTLGLHLLLVAVVKRLGKLADRTATDIDDLIAELLEKTRTVSVILVGVWIGSETLDLPGGVERAIEVVLVVGLLLQVGFWGTAVLNYVLVRYRRQQLEVDPSGATALGALSFLAKAALWVVVVLTALANLGIDITTFIASLGIGGIAVALALQNVLGDLFASLSIVLDKPFVIGDFVIVGDLMGTVEHVGLKTTRIRSLSGEQLVFSNSDLLGSRIRNFKRMNERRALFRLGVVYDTPLEELRAIPGILQEAVESLPETRFDRAHFASYGPSSLDFETVYYMLVPDYNVYMDAQQAINLEIFRRFQERGIEFAYPTQTLHVHQAAVQPGSPRPAHA